MKLLLRRAVEVAAQDDGGGAVFAAGVHPAAHGNGLAEASVGVLVIEVCVAHPYFDALRAAALLLLLPAGGATAAGLALAPAPREGELDPLRRAPVPQDQRPVLDLVRLGQPAGHAVAEEGREREVPAARGGTARRVPSMSSRIARAEALPAPPVGGPPLPSPDGSKEGSR